MTTVGKYIVTRANLVIDNKTYNVGDDVSWWDRAPEFVGKSVRLVQLDKRQDKPSRYDDMGDDELRIYAKAKGVNVTWNMKRETILERLEELD